MSFTADLRRFSQRTQKERDTLIRFFCLNLLRDVVLGTPVDTGRARANWQATLGSPATGIVESEDRNGGTTAGKGSRVAQKAAGEVFYITNNLPYIYRLEFEGHSSQAPAGWVRTSIDRNLRLLR